MENRVLRCLAAVAMCGATGIAAGQCPNLRWTGEFAGAAGLASGTSNGFGNALQVFDPDGPRPAAAELYIGGQLSSAGGVATRGIARWDGRRWADVGGGVGPNLSSTRVLGMGLHDPDGDGPLPPVLVVAGTFQTAGNVAAQGIAMWNGTSWQAMGAGLINLSANVSIVDFDEDGTGPRPPSLIVASEYFTIPGAGDGYIARWDGQQWSAVTGGPTSVYALAVFDDDGPGPLAPALYAGVDFTPGLYRWDGAVWAPVGGGVRSAQHRVASLAVIDEDGPGPGRAALWVGGAFSFAGETPVANIARWDGQQWSAIGTGVTGQVEDIVAVDSTGGMGAPSIYVATNFSNQVNRWDGAAWSVVGASNGGFGIITLFRLAAFDEDGAGPGLPALYYTAPGVTVVSGTPSRGLARYACACYANCDGSAAAPSLNVNDFICFMNRFAAGEAYANCDGSTSPPVLNVNDFACFLNRYAAGCL